MSKGYVDEIVGGDGKRRYTFIKSDGTRENGVVIEKDYIPQQEGSKFGSKEVNGGVHLEATASYSEGIVAIDAPEGAKMIVFTAPSDFNDRDTYTLNGSPVTLLDMNKEQLSDAWKAGVPVTLTVSGGSCFFKVGAGDYGTLPPQTRITAKAGNAEIALTLQTAADSPYFGGTLLVRKEGSAPEKVSDGVKIDVGKAAAYTDTGLTNDTEYHYRAFAYTPKKRYQTELTGAVASAVPRGEPTGYQEISAYTASTSWTVPEDNFYQIYVFGKGGNGAEGLSNGRPRSGMTGFGGGGGGAGGGALYRAFFTQGTIIPITVNGSTSSFGNYCSATSGTNGSVAPDSKTRGAGGSGGTASGGNVTNAQGGAGGAGGLGDSSSYSTEIKTSEKGFPGENGGAGGYSSVHDFVSDGETNYLAGGGGGGGGGGISVGSRHFYGNGGDASYYTSYKPTINVYPAEKGSSPKYAGGGGGGGGGNRGSTAGAPGGIGGAGVVIIEKGVYN